MSLRKIFTTNLRNARKTAGLSQMQLADRCNTATNYISEIELGKRFPSVEMIEKLSEALQIKPDSLFKDVPFVFPKNKILSKTEKEEIRHSADKALEKILRRY